MSETLFLVYFLYGLSFWAMGLAILLESGRSPGLAEVQSLRSLVAFGLIHGTHEWLESYILQAQSLGVPIPAWLPWLRLSLLTTSFAALFLYAFLTLRLVSPKYRGHELVHFGRLAVFEAAIIASAFLTYWSRPVPWLSLLDVLARYLMAVPAAFLAALALHAQGRRFREENRSPLAAPLDLAAIGFLVYGLAQVFVRSMDMFPARYINQEAFLAATGLPIQFVRTIMAVLITVGLIRATQIVEKERQIQLIAAHRARLDALEQREVLRRELLRHIVRAQEDERARIARELHDETAQLLSAVSLELATLRSKLKRTDITEMVDHLQHLTRQMSQGIYHLVHDLRPAQLDDLGLVAALNFLFSQDYCPKGLDVSLDIAGQQRRLDPLAETVLFRVVQESLNNVARHSGAKQAGVALEYGCDKVILRIADQGLGFNPNEDFRPPRGWGLAGMRERVESIGGELNLQSAPGQGTTVEVNIPVIETKEKGYQVGYNHIAVSG